MPAMRHGVESPKRSAISGLVDRVVEHRSRVVGHAAVDGDVGADARISLTVPTRVERDAGVGDERAAGLAQHRCAARERAQHRRGVLLDGRRPFVARVGDRKAAADVHDRIAPEPASTAPSVS